LFCAFAVTVKPISAIAIVFFILLMFKGLLEPHNFTNINI